MIFYCARPLNPQFDFKGSLVDPPLRASNEHIPIVRVPRAGGRPGYPSHPSKLARCSFKDGADPAFLARVFEGVGRLFFTARIERILILLNAPSELARFAF